MAIQKEIWADSIVEGLFADDTFAVRCVNHSGYVAGSKVHVPNAGSIPAIVVDSTNLAEQLNSRTDTDLAYDIHSFRALPIVVKNSETVELSYDKRNSVLAGSKSALLNKVHSTLLEDWVGTNVQKVATTGAAEAAHIASATGNRKKLVAADVLSAKKILDGQDIPSDGRVAVLDAVMYNQLLESLTDAQVANFLAGADPITGVVGRYMGFDFYMRSQVVKTTNAGAKKLWSASGAATDCAAGIFYHQDAVSRALGDVAVFDNQGDAKSYGDVISFEVLAGGSIIRSDNNGVVVVYQGTPS
ncbi:MAG: hypothetical protein HUJ96_08670 [Marinilabiliaceae bacterium]|nr:hypothetical protein [Marinilabiliaceae bacterium]